MTYEEKVEWLEGYQRQAGLAREMREEMAEMKKMMEEQRAQAVGQAGKRNWMQARQAREMELLQERRLALAAQEARMTRLGDCIEDAIDALPSPQQRRILRLLYLGGMSQRAISAKMGFCRRHICREHREAVVALDITPEMLKECG